jgi:hypothetical protein
MPDSIAAIVNAALADVTVDAPGCAEAMACALESSWVLARVGEDALLARVDGGCLCVQPAGPIGEREPDVFLASTPRALLAVLEGTDALLDAIRADRVRVRAAATDAARLFELLRHFVEGVARSRDGASHLDRFRAYVDEPSASGGNP